MKRKIQVQDLLDATEGSLAGFVQEDDELSSKQDEITRELADVQGDYRAVTAKTRELDGVRKRRDKISLETSKLEQEVDKITPVMKQIMAALKVLDDKERDLVVSFQKTGGDLRQAIVDGEKARASIAQGIDGAVLKTYEQVRTRCGGVALAELSNGNSCSACRHAFDQSRMSKIKGQAPLATCPACGRLLVVGGGE